MRGDNEVPFDEAKIPPAEGKVPLRCYTKRKRRQLVSLLLALETVESFARPRTGFYYFYTLVVRK